MTGHVYAATILLMNNDFYNGLPKDLQELVVKASEEYRTEQRELAQKQDVEFLEKLKETGMKVNELTDEQREQFREAAKSVYDQYVPEIGEELVNKALDANK
jgi:TRAP-type C4-dicarboxylate transport system substrate-binding protein